MSQSPILPESAPFTPEQRTWLNGYLAALYATPATPEAVAPSGPPITIFWGSQSGNAEGLAEAFGEQLQGRGFKPSVLSMEDFSSVDLTSLEHLLVISSTWGEGDPPDNAVEFWEYLSSDEVPQLPNLKFSVLGLGDTNYLDFCAMGKLFDARLEALGANRFAQRGDCDVDFEESAEAWFSGVLANLGNVETASPTPTEAGNVAVAESWSKNQPFPARLTRNLALNGPASARDTRHFEIALGDSGLEYEVGDVLGVFAKNCPELVQDLLAVLGLDGDDEVPDPDGNSVSLRLALQDHYSITTPARKFLTAFATRTKSDKLAGLLQPEAKQELADYLWGREMIDLLQEFPDHGFTASEFVAVLGKLTPRLYSIASSPKAHPGEVHLTVARVAYESHGRARKGVASTWLSDRVAPEDEVPVFFQVAKHFKLPSDPATDVIMVGPGTGIAPFRAFLEERQAIDAPGKNWLFFGNPHRETDFLYEDQLSEMSKEGVLNRLDTAWSRDQAEKIYVQDLMQQNAALLWEWIEGGAHFYVCGDAKRMAKDVDAALHAAIAVQGGHGEEGAAEYVSRMKKEKRYQRDVY